MYSKTGFSSKGMSTLINPLFYAYINSDKMNCVLDPINNVGGIFIGNLEAANDLELLKKNNIKAVLTVANGTGLSYKKDSFVQDHQILQADDYPHFDLSKLFEAGIQYIDRCRKTTNVLVHCHAGISRSSTMVISYIMKTRGWRCQKTLSQIRKRRPIVCPNPGFMRQLMNFEKKVLSKQSSKDVNNTLSGNGNRGSNNINNYESAKNEKVGNSNNNDFVKRKEELMDEFKNLNLTGNGMLRLQDTELNREQQKNGELKGMHSSSAKQKVMIPVSTGKKVSNYHYERKELQKKFNMLNNQSDNGINQKGVLFGKLLNVYNKGNNITPINKKN